MLFKNEKSGKYPFVELMKPKEFTAVLSLRIHQNSDPSFNENLSTKRNLMNEQKTVPQEQQSYPPLRTLADAVRYFIQSMDIDMLYTLLDDKITYQEFHRNEFLLKLERVMEDFKSHGDTFLNAVEGRCGDCYKEKTGYLFIGNNSKRYMNLLFDLDKGEITDLFECSNFKTQFKFRHLTRRVYVDPNNRIFNLF
jgi:hypothetical protein